MHSYWPRALASTAVEHLHAQPKCLGKTAGGCIEVPSYRMMLRQHIPGATVVSWCHSQAIDQLKERLAVPLFANRMTFGKRQTTNWLPDNHLAQSTRDALWACQQSRKFLCGLHDMSSVQFFATSSMHQLQKRSGP